MYMTYLKRLTNLNPALAKLKVNSRHVPTGSRPLLFLALLSSKWIVIVLKQDINGAYIYYLKACCAFLYTKGLK